MIRKSILTTLVGAALTIGASSAAFAATTLKLSHIHSRDHVVHKAMDSMAKEVQKETNGEVRIRIYTDATLGSQRESMEQIQNGIIDIAKTNASDLEAFSPSYSVFGLPYLFRDQAHYYKVKESELGESILASSRDKGFIGLTYYDAGARSFYATKAINSPDDLKGMKIRVQQSPTAINMVKAMGGSPTPLAMGELYTALQQGVVDGAENNIPSYTLSRHHEVAKFYTFDEHTMVPDVLVMSTKSFDALTPEQQKIVKKAAHNSMELMKTLWAESVKEERAKAEKQGVTFITPDKAPFVKAVQPMYDVLATEDPELLKVVDQIKAM